MVIDLFDAEPLPPVEAFPRLQNLLPLDFHADHLLMSPKGAPVTSFQASTPLICAVNFVFLGVGSGKQEAPETRFQEKRRTCQKKSESL